MQRPQEGGHRGERWLLLCSSLLKQETKQISDADGEEQSLTDNVGVADYFSTILDLNNIMVFTKLELNELCSHAAMIFMALVSLYEYLILFLDLTF